MVAAVLLGLTSLVVLAPPAGACECAGGEAEAAFAAADAAFVGTATDLDGDVWAFDVERVYKGHISEEQGVTVPSGPCAAFGEGDRVLVFADRDGDGGWIAGACNGSTVLDGAVPASFGRGLLPAPGTDLPDGGGNQIAQLAAVALMGVAVTGLFGVARGRARIAPCPPSAPPSSLRS